jgi:aryl-alcohol dehydrogenase-like predicted oxidoreductase
MEYRYLGRTGLRVSELCLGAMTFGREADEGTSRAMMDRFAEAGGTFIDTADAYTNGVSEQIVGRWLAGRPRDEWVVATKVRWRTGEGPNGAGLSRARILASVEGSLRRLGTDHIDLYQVHAWDPGTPLEETLSTLDLLVRSGKVRYLGVSNFAGWQVQKAVDISARMGWEPFVCLQPLYNLLDREIEWDLLPVCRNEGLGVIPWSPLRGGWLTGRYRRGMTAAPAGSRISEAEKNNWRETFANYATERTWQVLDAVFAVAEQTGRTPAQVSLRWLLQQPDVTGPIIGARNLDQLEDNLGALGWTLTGDQLAALTEASDTPPPYPHDLMCDPDRARRPAFEYVP